jgi:hypothetical protein
MELSVGRIIPLSSSLPVPTELQRPSRRLPSTISTDDKSLKIDLRYVHAILTVEDKTMICFTSGMEITVPNAFAERILDAWRHWQQG